MVYMRGEAIFIIFFDKSGSTYQEEHVQRGNMFFRDYRCTVKCL